MDLRVPRAEPFDPARPSSRSNAHSSEDVLARTPVKDTVSRFADQQKLGQKGTPMSKASSSDATVPASVPDGAKTQFLRDAVVAELKGHAEEYDEDWAKGQYINKSLDDAEIEKFLKTSPLYDTKTKRWTQLDSPSVSLEKHLYGPVLLILNLVLEDIGKLPTTGPIQRQARFTANAHFKHMEDFDECDDFTQPDFVTRAVGPSFEIPVGLTDVMSAVGYSNIASFIEVKLNEQSANLEDQLGQAGVYVRQIFIQQPNRNFVRVIVLNRQTFRMFHFDRAGVQYTPPIDFHTNAYIFVRFVLGISSVDEAVLGLNTAITWVSDEETGRKKEGTITVKDSNTGRNRRYKLTSPQPEIRSYSIRGAGIFYWRAKASGPKGKAVFVKFAWRSEGRVAEHVHLEAARGIMGVVQLVSYQKEEISTTELRNRTYVKPSPGCTFHNVLGTCVVLEAYGRPLNYFTSQRQFIGALRDAMAAHRALYDRTKLIHREFSPANILLGDDTDGWRGVVANLDYAVSAEREDSKVCTDPRPGGVLYVSISVLESYNPAPETLYPKHDFLDDMESAFYTLVTVMVAQNPNWTLVYPQHKIFQNWASKDPSASINAKRSYLSGDYASSGSNTMVAPGWSSASMNVLKEWREVFAEIHSVKRKAIGLDTSEKVQCLKALIKHAFSHYQTMIIALDTALQAMAVRLGIEIPNPLPIERPLTIKLRPLPQIREFFVDPAPALPAASSSSQVAKTPKKRDIMEVMEVGDDSESPLKGRRVRLGQSGVSKVSRSGPSLSMGARSSKLRN